MDTQKRTRKTRSKSQSKSENSSSEAEPEVAPNLNGDETNESKGATENNDAPGKEESVEEKPIEEEGETKKQQGRKRKASEMKDDSISGIEAIVSEEKKEKSDDVDMEAADAPAAPVADESKTEESIQAIEECLMDTADDSKEIKLPPKQTLGKGKRARIPNKRYSDILLSSSPHHTERTKTRTAAIAAMENGETQMPADLQEKENMGNESGLLSDSVDSPAFTSSGVTASKKGTLASPAVKKQKTAVDLSNPNYLKPFQYGWKRELVYRATSDIGAKRNGDIYYYTPTGKKVRSMREVSENLKDKKLTLDDFTFFKEPLGIDDPEKEIIREAKFKAAGAAPAPPKKTVTPKVTKSKATSPKAASPTLKSTNAATTVQTPTTTTTTTTPAAADSPKPKSATKTMNSFKMKLPGARKQTKKKRDEEEMEVGIYPPNWQSPPKKVNKWGNKSPERSAKSKRTTRTSSNPPAIKSDGGFSSYMDNYLQNLAYGYNTLLYVFQYLKVQDLLRAGCVCHMWRDIASHPLLWRTVRMKNSQVHSFEGLASALEKHNTVHLDLRKMLLPGGGDEIWPSFSQAIKRVDSLRKIELCRCPATVVEQLPTTNPKLEVINAVTIKCETMSLAPFQQLKNLQELRLKSTAGLTLNSDLHALKELTQLKHLSLTSIKELTKQNLDVIAELKNLESLDLGECTDFPKTFGMDILTRLTKLEKLRLEKGQGSCYTFEILEAVKSMPKLEQLELVNFDIKTGFDKALGACTNIKKLLIIPTYISQSATTNHMVLGGVLRLRSTLSHFVWGVTLELLRVTELFVDQCEEPKEKKEKKAPLNGDSIPVLKPVPLLTESDGEIPPAHDPPQVEILPLPNLQKLLLQSLPTTRVKILKIPFHATWRQSITDTVN